MSSRKYDKRGVNSVGQRRGMAVETSIVVTLYFMSMSLTRVKRRFFNMRCQTHISKHIFYMYIHVTPK